MNKKTKKPSVLLLDLDGTTVPMVAGFNGEVSPQVEKAIKDLILRGVHVAIATGRPMGKAMPIIKQLGIKEPCIFGDGAVVYDVSTDTFVDSHFLSPQKVQEIVGIVRLIKKDKPTILVSTLQEEVHYSEELHDQYVLGIAIPHLTRKEIEVLHETLSQDDTIVVRKITKTWEGGFGLIAISDVRATKQVAVAHLMSYLKVTSDKIVAVGDSENDIPMLLAAGIGVAMGNASDSLKSIAEYVAPSVFDHGVVDVINKYFPLTA